MFSPKNNAGQPSASRVERGGFLATVSSVQKSLALQIVSGPERCRRCQPHSQMFTEKRLSAKPPPGQEIVSTSCRA